MGGIPAFPFARLWGGAASGRWESRGRGVTACPVDEAPEALGKGRGRGAAVGVP